VCNGEQNGPASLFQFLRVAGVWCLARGGKARRSTRHFGARSRLSLGRSGETSRPTCPTGGMHCPTMVAAGGCRFCGWEGKIGDRQCAALPRLWRGLVAPAWAGGPGADGVLADGCSPSEIRRVRIGAGAWRHRAPPPALLRCTLRGVPEENPSRMAGDSSRENAERRQLDERGGDGTGFLRFRTPGPPV
jgi:hypothetical protein